MVKCGNPCCRKIKIGSINTTEYNRVRIRLTRMEELVMREGYEINNYEDDRRFNIRKITEEEKEKMRKESKWLKIYLNHKERIANLYKNERSLAFLEKMKKRLGISGESI